MLSIWRNNYIEITFEWNRKGNRNSMKNIALITGITGQDGSYLAEFLLAKGYEVHGLIRRHSISNTMRIDHLIQSDY